MCSSDLIDLTLGQVVDYYKTLGVGPADFAQTIVTPAGHEYLKRRLAQLPQAEAVSILDARGKMILSSRAWPSAGIDLSDRDHFIALRDPANPSFFIGKPEISIVTGAWTMFFARRLVSESGQFLGVAVVSAQPSAFMRVYDSISQIPGASSLLARADGVVYLRHPDSAERAGENLPAGLEWHDIVSRGGGSYRSGGVFDKEPRWVAVQLLEKYPLVVNVAIAEDVALAGWRSRAIAITLVSTAMGLFLGLLLRMLYRHHQRVDRKSTRLNSSH